MPSFERSEELEFNPYAAPQTESRAPLRHYRVVLWRLTYGECWRLAPNVLVFLFMALFKTFRIRIATHSAVTYPDRLDIIEFEELPPHVIERWRPALDACPALGLKMKLCQRTPTLGSAESFALVAVRDDCEYAVTLTYDRAAARIRERTNVTTNVASRLSDERRAVTTDNRHAVAWLPDILTQTVPGRPLPELVARHLDWLAANALNSVPFADETLERAILARLQSAFDQRIERGLYVPISQHDYEKLVQQSPAGLPRPSRAARAARVLSKIEFSLWVLILVVVYLLVKGGNLNGGRRLLGVELNVVFWGLFALAVCVGVIRFFVARTRP